MKKIISILLVFIMSITMGTVAFATNTAGEKYTATLEASQTNVSVGDIITVNVNIPENSELTVFSFVIDYDESALEYVEGSLKKQGKLSLEESIVDETNGLVKYAGIAVAPITKDGSILAVQFKVLKANSVINFRIAEAYIGEGDTNVTNEYKQYSPNSITLVGSEPVEPEIPDTPVEPEIPEEPTQPEVPDTPVEPETPNEPTQPEIPDTPVEPEIPEEPVTNAYVSIVEPSKKTIKYKDEAVLDVEFSGENTDGMYVEWTANNKNFKTTTVGDSLKITSNKSGYTTFTATLFDADGNAIAWDTIEMQSKASFIDKIVWFFTNLF